jgi:hypothetical protein
MALHYRPKKGAMTFSITTLNKATLSIMILSIMTLNITKFGIKDTSGTFSINVTQHKTLYRYAECQVLCFVLSLCWVLQWCSGISAKCFWCEMTLVWMTLVWILVPCDISVNANVVSVNANVISVNANVISVNANVISVNASVISVNANVIRMNALNALTFWNYKQLLSSPSGSKVMAL